MSYDDYDDYDDFEDDEDAIEFTQEEFDEMMSNLSDFEDSCLEAIATSSKYEIIPTSDESGNILGKKELSIIKNQCLKMGYKILYKIEKSSGETMILNLDTNKCLVLTEGCHWNNRTPLNVA